MATTAINLLQEFSKKRLAAHWHKPVGALAASTATMVLIFLTVLYWMRAHQEAPLIAFGSSVASALLVLLIWFLENNVPKIPKDKVGILLVIRAEEDAEAKRIQTDFTCELIKRLKSGRSAEYFSVIPAPPFLVDQLNEPDESKANALQIKWVEKLGAHFVLRASAKRRKLNGSDVHILKFDAMIRHATIPNVVSQRFANDISQLIPRETHISVDGDAIAFEATSEQIGMGAKYTIAVAAAMSGALPLAEELLIELESQSGKILGDAPFLQFLRKQVPLRILAVQNGMMQALGKAHSRSHDPELLRALEPLVAKILVREPTNYPALLISAIIHFLLHNDVAGARATLGRCRNHPDPTHLFSLAFLDGYEGNLREAHDLYRRASHKPLGDQSVPVQTEEFIHLVIQREPSKSHLLFCSALVNYNIKGDYVAARRDFEQFLSSPTIKSFPWAEAKARELLEYCDRYAEDPM